MSTNTGNGAGTVRRRARGEAKGMHALYARVDRSAAAFVQDSAQLLGVSNAEFVEALIFHAQGTVDATGVPSWWNRPVPASTGRLDLTG